MKPLCPGTCPPRARLPSCVPCELFVARTVRHGLAKDSAMRSARVTTGRVARWFVYIARCSDETLYVGIARDVAARIAQHDAGRGARYTRGRAPLRVLATRRCRTQGDALRLERALKRLDRSEKIAMAASRRRLAILARRCSTRDADAAVPASVRR